MRTSTSSDTKAIQALSAAYPDVTFTFANIMPDSSTNDLYKAISPYLELDDPHASLFVPLHVRTRLDGGHKLMTNWETGNSFNYSYWRSKLKNVVLVPGNGPGDFMLFFTTLPAGKLERAMAKDSTVTQESAPAQLVNTLLETYASTLSTIDWLGNKVAKTWSYANLDEQPNQVDVAWLASEMGLTTYQYATVALMPDPVWPNPKHECAFIATVGSETQFLAVCGSCDAVQKYTRTLFKIAN